MKLQSVKMVLLAAAILASPVLTFAGGQPRNYAPGKNETQNRAGIAQNVNQGKGAGMTRSDVVLRGNAYRSETAQDSQALNAKSSAAGPNWDDTAFHK